MTDLQARIARHKAEGERIKELQQARTDLKSAEAALTDAETAEGVARAALADATKARRECLREVNRLKQMCGIAVRTRQDATEAPGTGDGSAGEGEGAEGATDE